LPAIQDEEEVEQEDENVMEDKPVEPPADELHAVSMIKFVRQNSVSEAKDIIRRSSLRNSFRSDSQVHP
jgi:hypothetical protein